MNKTKGFTLLEMLMVIVIIAVLVAIALPKYIDTVDIALGKRAYDSMQTIFIAQQRYYINIEPHAYTTSFDALDVKFPSATGSGSTRNFGKFDITLSKDSGGKTQGDTGTSIPNYRIVFNFDDETKQCLVDSNANAGKGSRVCRALGGKNTGTDKTVFTLP